MKSREFAEEYVRLHNEASAKYKAAFKRIGARMWHDDDAHPLKEENTAFIAEQMQAYIKRGHPEFIVEVYGHLPYPLTVMDSYPQCHSRRGELEDEIRPVWRGVNMVWRAFLAGKGIK